jgi:colanic acid/amylovoran biosynthesis glycosyltransferase
MGPMIMERFQDKPAVAGRTVVAHIHERFFEKSETFIHNTTVNLLRFYPVFIAWEYRNLDQFPIPPADRFSLTFPPGTWRWFQQGIGRRFLGREMLAERFLRQRQAGLLHSHFGHNGVWALRLKRALRLPLVTTFYGHDMSQASSLATWGERYQRLFKEGDLFLVEGPHMKKRLNEIGCPAEKIEIQRISIALANLSFRMRPKKKAGEKVILVFSGRFVEKKGLLIALQALHEARRTALDFEFRIIGDGPLKPEIERFIQEHEMGAYVRLLGFLNYNDYLDQMNYADLFLHPSVTAADGDSEGGAPTTILEAQALGLPVLSTRHADIPYVVIPGESALLSREGDADSLSTNIMRLLKEQDSWARMGAAGRRHMETFHDSSREIPRLEARYAELSETHER